MQQTAPHPPAPPPPAAGTAAAAGYAPLLMALLVFAITLLVTWGAWSSAQRNAQAQLREAFDYRTRAMTYNISRRMLIYEQVLNSARGFLRGSVDVPRAVFSEYYQSLRLDQNFPGIEALGIATALTPDAVAAHEAQVRADGFPDYRVHPAPASAPDSVPTSGPMLSVIAHIEPFNARNLRAFGFDMYSEPVRRAALLAARDSGEATLSGKVVLVQEGSGSLESGVLMYLPVYRPGRLTEDVKQRRAAIAGWIYAPFSMNDLMRRMGGVNAPELDVEIYDGEGRTPGTLLYQSAGAATHANPRLSTTTTMMI
ncbi:MAG: CHASE domain-containing protein, partial [Massilia sp.]